MKTQQELLKTWEYNFLQRGDDIKRYQYARKPRSKDILLYCDDVGIYINISNPYDMRAFAHHEIPSSKTWINNNTPLEELKQ